MKNEHLADARDTMSLRHLLCPPEAFMTYKSIYLNAGGKKKSLSPSAFQYKPSNAKRLTAWSHHNTASLACSPQGSKTEQHEERQSPQLLSPL